jgi:tRNA pseudouridine55 synthase
MRNVVPIYKPVGLTPYQSVLQFKKQFPEYADMKISYAGRLDPMAEGLLLLLVGEENKKRNEYEKLQKTYEFTILLGIETDTYDMLGIIKKSKNKARISKQALSASDFDSPRSSSGEAGIRISNLLSSFIGKRVQSYPPYSSKAVKGKPLYWWARENRLEEIEIPTKEIDIYDLQLISSEEIKISRLDRDPEWQRPSGQDLTFRIQENINKVSGNFRQIEILHSWENFFKQTTVKSFTLLRCFATCSSGTYVRGIAHEIGQKIGCGAIALSIKRTNVGEYDISSIIDI